MTEGRRHSQHLHAQTRQVSRLMQLPNPFPSNRFQKIQTVVNTYGGIRLSGIMHNHGDGLAQEFHLFPV